MKRKVSQIGPATLMVSLPSKWAKKFGVKKGNEIDVEEDSNRLILTIGKASHTKKIDLDVRQFPSLTRRYIMEAYRSGFDDVNVTFQTIEDLKLIKETSSNILLGFTAIIQDS